MKILKYQYLYCLLQVFLCLLQYFTLWKFSPQLPSYEKIINYKPNLSSRIYSSDGMLLKSFYVEERIFIPIERIPEKIKQAFISAEDKNFYTHIGVDFFAIARDTITNAINYSTNKRVVGASTITQQVVKIYYLPMKLVIQERLKR